MAVSSGSAPEQAFCAAIRRLAQDPPELKRVEAGHKQGLHAGLLLLEPLYELFVEQPASLSIDRFANHLMQLTGNQVKISLGSYWRGQEKFDDGLLVQHPSKKPMSLARLLEALRGAGTSAWLAQTAGKRGSNTCPATWFANMTSCEAATHAAMKLQALPARVSSCHDESESIEHSVSCSFGAFELL